MKRLSVSKSAVSQSRIARAVEPLEPRCMLSLTPMLVKTAISADAIASDPNLANYQTFDLQFKLDSGERWTAADLKVVLSKGTFYNAPTRNADFPQSNRFGVQPFLAFDTFVSASNFVQPTILGSFDPATGAQVFSSTQVNVAWGAFSDTGTGTITVARLTVTKGAVGLLNGQAFSTLIDSSNPKPFNFAIGTTIANITGKVYNDTDSSGTQNGAEAGLSGWQVYLDSNGNGSLDSSEQSSVVTTGSDGSYTFSNLPAGNYTVRQVVKSGFRQTETAKYSVLLSGGNDATGKNFGVTSFPMISGLVYNDSNGNGAQDAGEGGLANVKVYLDKNNNGKADSGEKFKFTGSDGTYKFDPLTTGTYVVREVTNPGTRRTSSKSSYSVALTSGAMGTGKNFGNTSTGSLSGTVFSDKNSNKKKDSGEGGLAGFRVYLDSNNDGKWESTEKFADSDSSGNWVFNALNVANYIVRVVSKTGYKITTATFTVAVHSGTTNSGKLIGEHKT